MARVVWKEGAIISIETRKNVFVLAQMLKSPFLMFYDEFSENEDWSDIDLKSTPVLFCKGVTKQFLKMSNIKKQAKIKSNTDFALPKYWIQRFPGGRCIKVWEGTSREREISSLSSRSGGSLIERDINAGGMGQPPIIVDSIPLNDDETIDKYETTSISVYPELNERLYLCYKLGKNIDPAKDIDFDRELPFECETYVDIISGKVELEKLGY